MTLDKSADKFVSPQSNRNDHSEIDTREMRAARASAILDALIPKGQELTGVHHGTSPNEIIRAVAPLAGIIPERQSDILDAALNISNTFERSRSLNQIAKFEYFYDNQNVSRAIDEAIKVVLEDHESEFKQYPYDLSLKTIDKLEHRLSPSQREKLETLFGSTKNLEEHHAHRPQEDSLEKFIQAPGTPGIMHISVENSLLDPAHRDEVILNDFAVRRIAELSGYLSTPREDVQKTLEVQTSAFPSGTAKRDGIHTIDRPPRSEIERANRSM